MNHRTIALLMVLSVPIASANTADIPSLSGSGTERFIAGWWTSDGATVPAATTQYAPIFGDGAPRTTETDILAHATFYYNVTNFRVVSNTAACGTLGAGERFTFILRKNQAATTLSGSCTSESAANSFTLDTDIVAIAPGDRLSISVMSDATLLGRSLRAGVSLEGYKTITVTTIPVVDMTNEMLETVEMLLPLLTYVGFVIWAEISKTPLMYLLALLAGITATLSVWTTVESLRILVVASVAFVGYRAFEAWENRRDFVVEN